ncbi:TIGR04283 family arsenosugar biosynthesis glycosyltransferase [Pontiellaceae bacterium B12219]|nr:TIGR04283 family arsenosugar biosynthesis glycosyltransferase [Pontiellaceae bacterium B12219]
MVKISTSMKNRLIIFTRYPVPGKTKTRLIPSLGKGAAAALQREMTEHTVRQARSTGADLEVRYTGGTVEQMRDWLGTDLIYAEQGEGDLGERMQRACEDAFSKGWKKALLVGSDCPSNDWKNLTEAFQELDSHDVVIGPASDGGYYLIGLGRAVSTKPLFENIDWGGERVFEQTMQAASGLSVHQLPKRHDVDLVEDIPPKISVIVPTLNEEGHLFQTLEKVREGFGVEIIVVDGGSSDGTRSIFPNALECKNGRAAQQNLGAEKASGEILLFLHADTILPDAWDRLVRETLADESVAVGAFRFKVGEAFCGQKFIEDTANWRSIRGGLPYGDQGLFLRKEVFEAAGGFPYLPIMEDYAFVRTLRHFGTVVTRPEAAITSGRRWQQHGVVKVTLVNKLMILGYQLGISPERLARFYRGR